MNDAATLPPTVPLEVYRTEFRKHFTPAQAPKKPRFTRVSWQNLDLPGPELEYIIDGFLTRREKSVIAGPSQSGKSFLAIDAAMSIARGTPFFGNKVLHGGLVVYQAGEGALGIKRRLRAYRDHYKIPSDERVPFELITSKIDLYSPDGDAGPLIEEIERIKAEYDAPLAAVFIDTLATAQGGADENSGKDMGVVLGNIDRIVRECGTHVCLVHHMNAAGGKLRGHTSLYSNVDQVILVEHDKETGVRRAILDKQKDDENGLSIRFRLHSVPLSVRPDGKKITSCVCDALAPPETAKGGKDDGKGMRLTPQEDEAFRALMKAIGDHGTPRPIGRPDIPERVTVVTYARWREAFRTIASDPDMSDEAVKKALTRAGQSLMRFGVIGRVNPLVWWTGKPVRGAAPGFFDRKQSEPGSNVVPFDRAPDGPGPDDEIVF